MLAITNFTSNFLKNGFLLNLLTDIDMCNCKYCFFLKSKFQAEMKTMKILLFFIVVTLPLENYNTCDIKEIYQLKKFYFEDLQSNEYYLKIVEKFPDMN